VATGLGSDSMVHERAAEVCAAGGGTCCAPTSRDLVTRGGERGSNDRAWVPGKAWSLGPSLSHETSRLPAPWVAGTCWFLPSLAHCHAPHVRAWIRLTLSPEMLLYDTGLSNK
jgi:hypothetical protein